MKIKNLDCIEPIWFTDEKVQIINGGSGVRVSGSALAIGESSYAEFDANLMARETSPNGGSVSVGQLTTFAYGDDFALVDVSGEAEGDIAVVVEIEPNPAPINCDLAKVVAVDTGAGKN